MPTIKFNWFTVQLPPNSKINFCDALSKIPHKYSNGIPREQIATDWFALKDLSNSNNLITGQIVKIVMDEQPAISDIKSPTIEIKPIDMTPSQGICQETAFLYSPEFNVLMLQKRGEGVSVGCFQSLMRKICGVDWVRLSVLLDATSFEKYKRIRKMRSFEFSVANIKNPDIFLGQDQMLNSLTECSRKYGAINLSIKMTHGHKKGHLILENIKETIDILLNSPSTKKLKISGYSEDDIEIPLLNLIKDRMFSKFTASNKGRRIDMDDVMQKMRFEYSKKLSDLRLMFKDN